MTISFHMVGGVSWRDFVVTARFGRRLYQCRVYRGRPHRIAPFPLRLSA